MLEAIAALVVTALLLVFSEWYLASNELAELPGPRFKLPLIGDLLYLGRKPHETLSTWSHHYGSVFRISMGARNVVVVNSGPIIRSVSSNHYCSGRPKLPSWGPITRYFPFASPPTALYFRKTCLRALSLCNLAELPAIIDKHCEDIADALLADRSMDIQRAVYTRVGHVIHWLCFATDSTDGKELDTLISGIDGFVESVESVNMVDAIPILLKIIPSLRRSYDDYLRSVKLVDGLVDKQIKTFDTACNRSCLLQSLLKAEKSMKEGFLDKNGNVVTVAPHRILEQTGGIIGAGLETTSTTINWCLLLLAKLPQTQTEIYSEIETMVGDEKITAEHRTDLVLLEAFILEVLRFITPVPFAIPHSTVCEVDIEGKHIPAETFLLLNLWSANHDAATWKDPMRFDHKRFLKPTGKLCQKTAEQVISFGAGIRRCIGEKLARLEIFLFVANILKRCQLRLAADSKDIDERDCKQGLTLRPLPFNLHATAR